MVVLATLDYDIDVVAPRIHVKEFFAQDVTSFSFLKTNRVVMSLVVVLVGIGALALDFVSKVRVDDRAWVLAITLNEVLPLVDPGSAD